LPFADRKAARVDDPLGDALVIEVGDLLAEDEVLEEGGPTQPALERVLVVRDGLGEVGRQDPSAGIDTDAVEGPVARIHPGTRRRAGLVRRIRLGERAGDDRRVRLGGGSGLGRPRRVAVLARFRSVERKRGGQGLGAPHLALRGAVARLRRRLPGATHGRLGGPLALDARLSILWHALVLHEIGAPTASRQDAVTPSIGFGS